MNKKVRSKICGIIQCYDSEITKGLVVVLENASKREHCKKEFFFFWLAFGVKFLGSIDL